VRVALATCSLVPESGPLTAPRLRERATESSGVIEERIALARRQLKQAHQFDYEVENDDLERATESLAAIVERELDGAATMSER
jgi:guanylate kinase